MSSNEILNTLHTLYDQKDVIEIRIIRKKGKSKTTDSGYYDYAHFSKCAEDISKIDGLPGIPAIYCTVNPVQKILLARSNNRMTQGADSTTNGEQIIYRKYLPFDIDPVRPTGTSSNDEMHEKSIEKAHEVKEWLKEKGFPAPIIADSGNGAHLLYRINEPNTPEAKELINNVQKAVVTALNYPDKDGIDIQGFADANRIWKVYGTITKKGDEIHDQGIRHRRSKLLDVPDNVEVVPTTTLKEIAGLYINYVDAVKKTDKPKITQPVSNTGVFDIKKWMDKYNINVIRTKKERNRTVYVLETCPINSDHSGNKEAVIIQEDNGRLGFKCHHNSCSDMAWIDVREKFEPGYKNKTIPQNVEKKVEYPKEHKKDVGKTEVCGMNDVTEMCSLKGAIIPQRLGDKLLLRDEYMTLRDNGELYIYKDGVYCLDVKAGDTKAIANEILMHKTSNKNVNEGVSYVMHKTRIDRDDINCAPFIINMKNGMYDVLNDKLLPHNQKYKSTIQINTMYDPSAKCPAITKFLYELMDPLDVPLVIQFIGYCLIQDVAQQKALLIDGSARNGKSTLIKLISSMVGDSHISGESLEEISKDRFSTMQLSGKLVNAHPDLSANDIVDTSIFKTVVTETRLTGQGKGKDKIMFDNICTHIFACNKLPYVEEDETAYFRRFLQVTFPNVFDGVGDDKDILNKITTVSEKSGFFNFCMIGLRALLEHGEYCYLETTNSNEKRYLDKSNPVARFFNERTATSVNDTPKDVIYWGYVQWCAENGLKKLHNNPFWTQVHKQSLCEIARVSTGATRKRVCIDISLIVEGKKDQASKGEENAWTTKKHIQHPLLLPIRPSVQGIIEYKAIEDMYKHIYTYRETELKSAGRLDEGGKTPPVSTIGESPSDDLSKRFSENALFFSQRDVAKSICDTIQNLQVDGKTPIRSVIDHVLESGVTFDRYRSAIIQIKKEGKIFEPITGYYKCI